MVSVRVAIAGKQYFINNVDTTLVNKVSSLYFANFKANTDVIYEVACSCLFRIRDRIANEKLQCHFYFFVNSYQLTNTI
jgi:hypothetical protein